MAKNAAVIGHPIAHSKSPRIHNFWMGQYNISASYTAVDVAPTESDVKIPQLLVDENLAGFNITLPHKERIISFCDALTADAKAIGAVNTVYKDDAGRIIGTNTDAYGFWQNIVAAYHDFSVTGDKVCVLGAGGAARAVIYALKQQGASQIVICNRTHEKAQKLADEFGCDVCDWEDYARLLADCKLLVNTTSLGMSGQPPLEIDLSALPQDALVNDIVYAPLQTELLQKAAARGNKYVQGIGMLLYQAQKAFQYWYGVLPEVSDALQKEVLSS